MKVKWLLGFLKVPAAYFIIIYTYLHSWLWYSAAIFDNEHLQPFDFIVVGGGSAGAVVASRLARNFSVLLLEEGGYAPMLASISLISGVLPLTPAAWNFPTESQKFGFDAAFEKRSNWVGGSVLGGSSTLNFLLYVRGNRLDYDKWAEMGNDGWSYEDVLPYFKKSENNAASVLDDTYHGRDGEIFVEDRAWKSKLPQAFLAAGKLLGFREVDVNGINQTGFAIPQVTMRFGSRWDTYSAFLKSAQNGNLTTLRHAQVEKVLIDESNRACGVQYRKLGRVFKASANLEVILSAGAVNSPKILMLSGIGPKEHLEPLGIEVRSNLRVGENLQDHVYVPYGPLLHNDSTASLVHPLDLTAWWNYLIYGSGQYSSNGIDGIAFKATKFSENPDWPDVQIHFLPYSAASDHGVLNMEDKLWNELYYPLVHHDTASLFATLVRPKSRGWLRLRSADPSDPPIIDPQYYSHPDDVKVMIEGLKFAKEIIETPALKEYITMHDLPHPYCKQYQQNADNYLECLMRHSSATLYHPAGTCKMGPKTDTSAVVDSSLRVYGVKGLRVADASIIPVIPNGNTNAPVIMIGEKAADMILKNYSCKKAGGHPKQKLPSVVRDEEKEL